MDTTYVPIGLPSGDLSATRRERDWQELTSTSPFDVVVIGGGITGTGVALDAASRGLRTLLVERNDLAFGTSRWSSKLVHGGLRYLATGHVDVAWESAVERGHLMTTIAPHLIRALPQIVPVMSDTSLGSTALTRAGFLAGDALRAGARTPTSTLPPAHWISKDKVRRLAPHVDFAELRGGIMAWDGQLVDDARLVVAVARTAASFGATILTHTEAIAVSTTGVRLRNTLNGEECEVTSSNVIAATGVWAEELDPRVHVHPSRGTHVVLDAERLGNPRAALTIPVADMSGRYCFLLPRPDRTVLAGITDVGVDAIDDVPRAPEDDISWILEQVNRVLESPLTKEDVLGSFAGLRPLVTMSEGDSSSEETSDISRKHLVSRTPEGSIMITGGKLTTYRRMAQDAVDLITDRPCRTTSIALLGADPDLEPRAPGFFDPDPWVMRYGAEADRVRALAPLLPAPSSAPNPVADYTSVARVDIAHAFLHEGAVHADDVISRRLRLDSVDADIPAARAAVEEVMDALASAGRLPAGAF